MEQSRINKAYPAIVRLCELKLPIKKARQIYRLSNEMKEHFEFAVAEEQKCVSEFHGEYNADGTVVFINKEEYSQFRSRMDELNSSKLDWIIEPVVLTETDIGNQKITVSDIQALEGIVVFE